MSDTCGPQSRTPFAYYDPDECCWKTSQTTLLSGSDEFRATWPRSGMTRAGCAYELPMPALPTAELACSSLLPTPRATDGTKGGPNQRGSSGDLMLPSVVMLLPTPVAHDSGNDPATHLRKKPGRQQVTSLQVIVDFDLLSSGGRIAPLSNGGSESSDDQSPAPRVRVRGGNERLSPRLNEWMMGLPAGWVTDVPDIGRNDQLRIIGNGVVPQQATLAVRTLLGVEAVAA